EVGRILLTGRDERENPTVRELPLLRRASEAPDDVLDRLVALGFASQILSFRPGLRRARNASRGARFRHELLPEQRTRPSSVFVGPLCSAADGEKFGSKAQANSGIGSVFTQVFINRIFTKSERSWIGPLRPALCHFCGTRM